MRCLQRLFTDLKSTARSTHAFLPRARRSFTSLLDQPTFDKTQVKKIARTLFECILLHTEWVLRRSDTLVIQPGKPAAPYVPVPLALLDVYRHRRDPPPAHERVSVARQEDGVVQLEPVEEPSRQLGLRRLSRFVGGGRAWWVGGG